MLSKLTNWFITHVTGMRKSQRKTVAALVVGLIHSPSVGIAAIGRHMLGRSLPKSNINRVNRYLSNERINVSAACADLLGWLTAKKRSAFLSLDWTDLNNNLHQTLMLSLNARGRAIPILWRTVWKRELKGNRNRFEHELSEQLKRIAPPDLQIVILADRGFARVELLDLIEKLGFVFIIRTKRSVGVRGARWSGVLYSFKVRKGMRYDFGQVAYRDRRPKQVRLVLAYDRAQNEPWFLLTNLSDCLDRIVAAYAHRRQIEESFKDIKNQRNGWKLKGVDISTPERYDRLFLIIAFAYAWMSAAGLWGEQREIQRKWVASSTRKRRVLSLWRVGEIVFRKHRPSLAKLEAVLSSLILSADGLLPDNC